MVCRVLEKRRAAVLQRGSRIRECWGACVPGLALFMRRDLLLYFT